MWKCQDSADWNEDAKLGKGMKGSWGEDCSENEKRMFSGIFWDLINFMAKAENFTFTLVENDDVCGRCSDRYNCTGMTGLVNSGQVDIGLGRMNIEYQTFNLHFYCYFQIFQGLSYLI